MCSPSWLDATNKSDDGGTRPTTSIAERNPRSTDEHADGTISGSDPLKSNDENYNHKENKMTSDTVAQDRLPINTSMLTIAGFVALAGALLLGIAALIGSNVLMTAVREWANQQEVPPTESAKSFLRLLHNAALAGTTAGADAWRSEISSSSPS